MAMTDVAPSTSSNNVFANNNSNNNASNLTVTTTTTTTQVATTGIAKPHNNDVLCGRGGSINSHKGNEQFRLLVNKHKIVYLNARFKEEKRLIASTIVDQIRQMNPSGRFLAKDNNTDTWYDVGDEKARDKTSQALRENAPSLRQNQNDRVATMGGSSTSSTTTSSNSNSNSSSTTSSKKTTTTTTKPKKKNSSLTGGLQPLKDGAPHSTSPPNPMLFQQNPQQPFNYYTQAQQHGMPPQQQQQGQPSQGQAQQPQHAPSQPGIQPQQQPQQHQHAAPVPSSSSPSFHPPQHYQHPGTPAPAPPPGGAPPHPHAPYPHAPPSGPYPPHHALPPGAPHHPHAPPPHHTSGAPAPHGAPAPYWQQQHPHPPQPQYPSSSSPPNVVVQQQQQQPHHPYGPPPRTVSRQHSGSRSPNSGSPVNQSPPPPPPPQQADDIQPDNAVSAPVTIDLTSTPQQRQHKEQQQPETHHPAPQAQQQQYPQPQQQQYRCETPQQQYNDAQRSSSSYEKRQMRRGSSFENQQQPQQRQKHHYHHHNQDDERAITYSPIRKPNEQQHNNDDPAMMMDEEDIIEPESRMDAEVNEYTSNNRNQHNNNNQQQHYMSPSPSNSMMQIDTSTHHNNQIINRQPSNISGNSDSTQFTKNSLLMSGINHILGTTTTPSTSGKWEPESIFCGAGSTMLFEAEGQESIEVVDHNQQQQQVPSDERQQPSPTQRTSNRRRNEQISGDNNNGPPPDDCQIPPIPLDVVPARVGRSSTDPAQHSSNIHRGAGGPSLQPSPNPNSGANVATSWPQSMMDTAAAFLTPKGSFSSTDRGGVGLSRSNDDYDINYNSMDLDDSRKPSDKNNNNTGGISSSINPFENKEWHTPFGFNPTNSFSSAKNDNGSVGGGGDGRVVIDNVNEVASNVPFTNHDLTKIPSWEHSLRSMSFGSVQTEDDMSLRSNRSNRSKQSKSRRTVNNNNQHSSSHGQHNRQHQINSITGNVAEVAAGAAAAALEDDMASLNSDSNSQEYRDMKLAIEMQKMENAQAYNAFMKQRGPNTASKARRNRTTLSSAYDRLSYSRSHHHHHNGIGGNSKVPAQVDMYSSAVGLPPEYAHGYGNIGGGHPDSSNHSHNTKRSSSNEYMPPPPPVEQQQQQKPPAAYYPSGRLSFRETQQQQQQGQESSHHHYHHHNDHHSQEHQQQEQSQQPRQYSNSDHTVPEQEINDYYLAKDIQQLEQSSAGTIQHMTKVLKEEQQNDEARHMRCGWSVFKPSFK